jgi:hypothetical protein
VGQAHVLRTFDSQTAAQFARGLPTALERMKKRPLAKHQKQQDLVSIRRSKIDANFIQAFVLDSSDELVALQYVYDFNLDGLMFLRVEDITEIRSSVTDKFQKVLLEEEGLLQRVPFEANFELCNWNSLISQLSKEHELMILERERLAESDLFIGGILKVAKTDVHGRYFSGAANWAKEPEKLKLKDITSCQVGTNYINVYQRHFKRHAL